MLFRSVPSVAKSSISSTILSQCQTKFYLADPNAASDMISSYYASFGLEEDEIAALSRARMKQDYFYKSPNGSRMFQLELDKFQLALLCPPKSIMDELERRYGRNSGKELAEEILEAQGFRTDFYMKNYK